MLLKNFVGVLVINFILTITNVDALMKLDFDSHKYPFDTQLYDDVLDPDLCQRQLTYLTENIGLLARFLDAGIRIPRGILGGNIIDLGNFHQCLAISEQADDMKLEGKYCRIRVPIGQDIVLPTILDRSLVKFDPSALQIDDDTLRQLEAVNNHKVDVKSGLHGADTNDRLGPDSPLANVSFNLAICIPRPCTTEQAINGMLFNLTDIGFEFSDMSCRLPDDRPWAAADYVAIVVFSVIGFLTLISTCYDLYHSIYLKKGSKELSSTYTSFSVYTNTRRLVTFNSSPGSLECLDGIRALAIIWVILGHSFHTVTTTLNPIDAFKWSVSLEAAWITVAPLTVDTFFFLSGLLLVYTTVGKLGRMQLLKNLHVFYLHRLLRMFPVLATVILFEASFYMRVSDGPFWDRVATQVLKCRQFWWSTLLHLQNIVNPREACIGVTWYLAIDVQLHILSPILLFWVLTSRRAALIALNTGLFAIVAASTIFIFFMNFPSGIVSPNRQDEMLDFFIYYYVNILTRTSPFIVGMMYGYFIHICKKTNLKVSMDMESVTYKSISLACKTLHLLGNSMAEIPRYPIVIVLDTLSTTFLLFSLSMMLAAMYCAQIAMRLDWDNQLADNFFNSFLRLMWSLALGWLIFACIDGKAEPINWFLSLRMWKLPARISYAMYLVHYSIMIAFNSAVVSPVYFTVPSILFNFMAYMFITLILSFFVTLLIDSPCSTIFKLLLGGGVKKSRNSEVKVNDSEHTNGINN